MATLLFLTGVAVLGAIAFQAFASPTVDTKTPAIQEITLDPEYRDWKLISVAHEGGSLNDIRAILGNEEAFQASHEGTVPFPDGAVIARLAWADMPSAANNKVFGRHQSFVAGSPTNVQLLVKDSRKFAATGGWGFAQFSKDHPANEAVAKECFACHVPAKSHDYVFTHYAPQGSFVRERVACHAKQASNCVCRLAARRSCLDRSDSGSQFYRRTGKPVPAEMTITDPPEARSPFVLKAVDDQKTGLSAFGYEGSEAPPVIRARPGSDILITYRNRMDEQRREPCLVGPCMNMTNLHFHGLHVSPQKGQDDVITMAALPGETLQYRVVVPKDHPPGLYWYHTHPHGESYQQALDGMSGALVISRIERYAPEVLGIRERVIVLRDKVVKEKDPGAPNLRKQVMGPVNACGQASGVPQRIFSVNGAIRPGIPVRNGFKQFWRIVNASPDLYADLAISGQSFKVIALDGMPLAVHDPKESALWMQHVLVPPAGRVEAIVTGPPKGVHATLKSRCFDTGQDGDPNPEMVLADLVDRDDSRHLSLSLSLAEARRQGNDGEDSFLVNRRQPMGLLTTQSLPRQNSSVGSVSRIYQFRRCCGWGAFNS